MNALPKSQLLIVDDHPTNIKVLSDLLIQQGFQVLIARDGENALQKLERITPDLILLDVLMPGIDGFETCRRLKDRPATQDIPVIFMTALADPVDKVKGLTMGAVDYITKPFQQEEVLARVSTHLRLRHLSKQLMEQNVQLQTEVRSRQLAETALRSSEEKFAKAFRANPGPMLIATLAEGRILEANQAFCNTLSYPLEAVLHQHLQKLCLFVNAADADYLLATLREQSTIRNFECQLRTATGASRDWLISAEVVAIKDTDCILAMMMDISDCKRAAIAMEQAKATAEQANQAKTRFLSNISHELRTPLNTILGYIQLLERDVRLTREQRSQLETINRSSHHLLALINDVLEMTKIESGQLVLYPRVFDLMGLLDTLTVMLEPRVQARGIRLAFDLAPDVPRYICVDETKLRQILLNLLGNGIKFTERGQVSLHVSRENGPQIAIAGSPPAWCSPADQWVNLRFTITDTGAGIAPEELDGLFDPFTQTEAGRQTEEGTGLGLPISQQLVTLMGGHITVESTVGVGSVFHFTIPVGLASAGTIPAPILQQRVMGLAPGQPTHRVLVVEDQPTNRDLLTRLLTLVGFEVQVAVNGQEAIAQYQRWHPHLILMDIRMPVMDGYEATRQIRAMTEGQPATAPPPPKIIALTANAFEDERQVAIAAGCDGFIRKPIQEAEFFASIAEQLGVRYRYSDPQLTDPSPLARPLPNSPPPLPQELPEAVMAELFHLIGSDRAFLQDYLQSHIDQMPLLVQTLREAIAQQDAPTLCRTAHTLKGMGLTFAAQSFADLCLTIEKQAAAGTTEISADCLHTLETDLVHLLAALRSTLVRL
ncbi:MAG: response regulator [Synechococcales bacterium]|nr:response regulator [Synechococcales bacterium]